MRIENYQSSSSKIVKRSPAVSGRKSSRNLAATSITGASFRTKDKVGYSKKLGKSVEKNISSIDKALKKSNNIIPWKETGNTV